MDTETDYEFEMALDKVDHDIDMLGDMIHKLDIMKTDWAQVWEYLSWIRSKMTVTYRLSGSERMFNQIMKIDDLLVRIDQKQAYVDGL
jgi:hypothetical protein